MSGPDTTNSGDDDSDEDVITFGARLPGIVAARHVEDMKIRIEWDDGREEIVDVRPAIMSHRHFVALRDDPQAFQAFKVRNRGDCLVWPGGQELSASWIEELAPTALDNVEFRQAMDELKLSLDGMAARLGIARRLVADYRKDKAIPLAIGLATRYLLERHKKAS